MTSLARIGYGKIEQFLSKFGGAGLSEAEIDDINRPHSNLIELVLRGIRAQRANLPWGEPFTLTACLGWRSLDGTEPGRIQIRRNGSGSIQVREEHYCYNAYAPGHETDTCPNCWTVRELAPSWQWQVVTEQIHVQVPEEDNPNGVTRPIVIRRRQSRHFQDEAQWSEPWDVPDYDESEEYRNRGHMSGDIYAPVTIDVQVYSGRTYPRGILVRQATRLFPTPQWATPRFIPVPSSPAEWVDLVPDGSLQVRFWVRNPDGSHRKRDIQARQRIGRPVVSLVVEPHWLNAHQIIPARKVTVNGHRIELAYGSSGRYGSREIVGAKVIYPDGSTRVFEVTNRYILIAPNLRVEADYQGSVHAQYGVSEPVINPITWSQPVRFALSPDTWVYPTATVRVRPHHTRDVMVATRAADGTWAEWSQPIPGTVNEVTSGLRLTVPPLESITPPEQTIEVQHALTPSLQDPDGTDPDLEADGTWLPRQQFQLDADWHQIAPNLRLTIPQNAPYITAQVWRPNLHVANAPWGSAVHGGWNGYQHISGEYNWTEIPGTDVRVRLSAQWHNVAEVQHRRPPAAPEAGTSESTTTK